ncbi:unnamed protein product [Caenorhabditis auriculariae]|uniref:CX domain-containing protein n=1 Tax=Caenorhabditis auriculariae TaxID=2777116 RepID=A0A8S1HD05_9PELO|nr:unnamed protein product [Caenorhabditis auriculariae]
MQLPILSTPEGRKTWSTSGGLEPTTSRTRFSRKDLNCHRRPGLFRSAAGFFFFRCSRVFRTADRPRASHFNPLLTVPRRSFLGIGAAVRDSSMASQRLTSWSRWDIPQPGGVVVPSSAQRFFEQVLINPSIINVQRSGLVEQRVNTIDPSFYDCIYGVVNSEETIVEQCYRDIGCCANGCCTNSDWQTKYGWAVALICLFCLLVIVAMSCWVIVWLVNRSKDKRQKKQLLGLPNISPATSQMSLAYPIPNGYHYGTGPFQSPPLNGYRAAAIQLQMISGHVEGSTRSLNKAEGSVSKELKRIEVVFRYLTRRQNLGTKLPGIERLEIGKGRKLAGGGERGIPPSPYQKKRKPFLAPRLGNCSPVDFSGTTGADCLESRENFEETDAEDGGGEKGKKKLFLPNFLFLLFVFSPHVPLKPCHWLPTCVLSRATLCLDRRLVGSPFLLDLCPSNRFHPNMIDIRRFDVYRKVPKDLTQPTTAGAVISLICVVFITFMIFNDVLAYVFIDIKSELYVDDPGRVGKIDVEVNVSFPYMACEYLGVDIQDENGRHEVGFKDQTTKITLEEHGGCRFESKFEINKIPGNFHLSTHSAAAQPDSYDMRHIIHSITFGDDVTKKNLKGSFDPLRDKDTTKDEPLYTHEYILKIVPSVYEDISGHITNSYQYTFGHKAYVTYHHSGKIIPAIWFKYELQPITVKQTERRQSFYTFLTSICAVVGGTFTVAGIIDSSFFTITEIAYQIHRFILFSSLLATMDSLQTIVLLLCFVGMADAMMCNITVKFRLENHEKTRVDLLVPALEIMSEPVVLTEWKEEKHVKIVGENCERKPWIFMTYVWKNGDWEFKKKAQTKLMGNGWIMILINDDFNIVPVDRYGIACAEGTCG